MILSDKTIKILKNFAKINGSIKIKPGNCISTKTEDKVVIAQAVVDEEFPVEFAIVSLTEFLSVLSTFKTPKIEFDDKFMTISDEGYEVQYVYGTGRMNWSVADRITNKPEHKITFDLTKEMYAKISDLSASLGTDELHIRGDGEKVFIELKNSSRAFASKAKVECGVETDKEFTAIIAMRQFIQIPVDYRVGVLARSGIHLYNSQLKLDYWLALMSSSDMKAFK